MSPRRIHVSGIDAEARKAVVRQLAGAYDHFAELEQVLVAEGRYTESQGAHEYAVRLLRAYKVELDDPIPAGLDERPAS